MTDTKVFITASLYHKYTGFYEFYHFCLTLLPAQPSYGSQSSSGHKKRIKTEPLQQSTSVEHQIKIKLCFVTNIFINTHLLRQ